MVRQRIQHTQTNQTLSALIGTLLSARRRDLMAGKRIARPWKRAGLDESKTFTYTQFREHVYTNFPRLRRGGLKSFPDRQTIMEIADYLECTLIERNQLLNAAGHPAVPRYIAPDELGPFIAVASDILAHMELPGYLMNRDWDIHLVNENLLYLFDLNVVKFAQIPRQQCNFMQFLFDIHLPIRSLFEISTQHWHIIAQHHLSTFRNVNMLCEFEVWYQERIQKWQTLKGFSRLWGEGSQHMTKIIPYHLLTDHLPTVLLKTDYGALQLRPLSTTLSDEPYPRIVSYRPADQIGWKIFEHLGITHPPIGAVYQPGDIDPLPLTHHL